MNLEREFHGPNAAYVLELYERYRRDPNSVDAATRAFFEQWNPPQETVTESTPLATNKIVATVNLAQAIRGFGHLKAQLDPLGFPAPGDPALELETHSLS